MGKTRGAYDADFPVGTCVRIAEREALENFIKTWQFHHQLRHEQLEFAGRVARVQSVGYYHGADELYTLAGVYGTWHEQLLRVATPEEAAAVPELPTGPSRNRRGIAITLGALVALAVGFSLYMGTMLLGAMTGVIAMCATAPAWWAFTFFGLLLIGPLTGALVTGFKVGKWYLHRA